MKSFSFGITLIIFLLAQLSSWAQTNGIFADFTTSMGNFTCQLSYSNSPAAVANFIGLATGERAWLDVTTGEARTTPFYNGLTFHRVVAGFVIQAGSPNGLDTDGPGYVFKDQFSSLLTFGAPWVLAMANSGPDSNGSQFFITVAPFTSGNNTYDVFGHVVSGTNVVAAINKVATDKNDKPLTKVVIQQVSIRRVGTAAEGFDIHAQNLPTVTNIPVRLGAISNQFSLSFSNKLFSDNLWYASTNLVAWSSNHLGLELSVPTSNSVPLTIDAPHKFFRVAQIQYPSSTFAPKDVLGRTVTLVFPGAGTNKVVFNQTGGGTYSFPGVGSGTVTSYSWSQDPYRGFLWPIKYSGLNEMTLRLDFTSLTNGTFSGTVYGAIPSPVSGTFKLK